MLVLRLPATPRMAEAARSQVRSTLVAYDAEPEQVDTVELLTSELATNSIIHAGAVPGADFVVTLIREGGMAVVEVRDPSRELPKACGSPEELNESGRGLFLVDALAHDHGVYLTEDDGKVVWFELPLWPHRSATPL